LLCNKNELSIWKICYIYFFGSMSLSNLRSFAYNILKKLGDDVVKDRQFVEIGSCRECGNEILGLVYEPLTILACGHIYHRRCIEKNFLLTQSSICPTSDCSKSVEPVVTERRFSQSSQSSTSSIVRRMSNQLQINFACISRRGGGGCGRNSR